MPETFPQLRSNGQFTVHHNNEPLHQRVPTHDDEGKSLADFMILMPKLNKLSAAQLKPKMASMQAVLVNYREVVFVDLNMKLNILWVSIKPTMGLIEKITCEIQELIPEAKLISGEFCSK